jgi:hypothetical protein
LDGVVFCDAAKTAIKGYRVVPVSAEIGRLEEFTGAGGAWQSFTVGPDIVQVDLNPGTYSQKTGGLFGLYDHAEFLWFNMRYRMTLGGAETILPLQTESVKCRNAPSRNW